MRGIFIQYSHPDTPHVSSMRMRYFAEALARRGHQIVLLSRTLSDGETAKPLAVVAAELVHHDWLQPYFLACAPLKCWSLELMRDTLTPRPLRQALIFGHYVFGDGVFSDWSLGSRLYWQLLADQFQPDIVWGTYGSLDSWVIARGIALAANAPWAMDAKDGWEVSIHPLIRRLLARRFCDATALTTNSVYLAEQFTRWFPQRAELIYSGVDEYWIQPSPSPLKDFRIMLVGGIYAEHNLASFIRGLRSWLEGLTPSERERVSVCYAGSDTSKVKPAMAELEALCRTDILAYLPLAELATLCQGAAVNAYLWNPKTFHHKLVELLCCQRPIISFPGERAESVELARQAGGSLNICRDERGLEDVLTQIWRGGLQPVGREEQLQHLTWSAQSILLERVLQNAMIGEVSR